MESHNCIVLYCIVLYCIGKKNEKSEEKSGENAEKILFEYNI